MKLNKFAYTKTVGVISTCGSDFKPSSANVFYEIENGKFYFLTSSASQKIEDIQANPNVCLVVTDDNYYKQLQVYGTAKIITELEGHFEKITKAISDYSKKTHHKAPYTEIFALDNPFVEVEVTPENGRYFESSKSITEETY